MRDILVTLLIFGSIPFILRRPYVGVLVWSWIGYMNPHQLAFGFAQTFPFAALIGLITIATMILSRETKGIPPHPAVFILIAFIIWMGISCTQAMYPDEAWESYTRVIKIQLMVFITMMMIRSREQIHQLIWVIALSFGFYGIKGGIFTILNKGQFMVLGPPGGFFEGNTEIGLAILMALPLFYYLLGTNDNRWVRIGLIGGMILMAIGALGTHSRGALVAAAGVLVFFWFKSHSKLITGSMGIILAISLFLFMPASWHEKMETIINYEQDESAMGRINAWWTGYNVANDRLMGGGFEFWSPQSFLVYAPNPLDFHDAHSIYFEVLGEHGYGGLVLFLLFGICAFLTARSVIMQSRGIEYFAWANLLARMIQVSLVAYVMGGSFLGLAYADIGYQLVAILIVIQLLVKQGVPESETEHSENTEPEQQIPGFIRKPVHPSMQTAQTKSHDKTKFIR